MAGKQNTGMLSADGLTNKLRNIFQTKQKAVYPTQSPISGSPNNKSADESYREWGVRWSGNAGANHTALSPALQSCYTQNVNEQKGDIAKQQENQQQLQSEKSNLEGQIKSNQDKLEAHQDKIDRKTQEIVEIKDKIDEIKCGDKKNTMATVNFYIGMTITVLLALYLFIFYSSASYSAFFGNNNITGAGQAIFDPHCYSDAVNTGWGQMLFICLMPMIFLGLGFLIHQFGESESGFSKYLKIGALYFVTFIFDALLAFEISQKVYTNTVIDPEPYTMDMAFSSPHFWIVIFSGFIAYVIWGLVFDFTLQHFDNMNAHTREIQTMENKIDGLKSEIEDVKGEITGVHAKINSLTAKIAGIDNQLQSGFVIDTTIVKQALSNFFTGWIAYMELVGKTQEDKNMASETYNQFIQMIQNS